MCPMRPLMEDMMAEKWKKSETKLYILRSFVTSGKDSSEMNYSVAGLVCLAIGLILIVRVFYLLLWRHNHGVLFLVLAIVLMEGLGMVLIRKATPS